MNEGYENYISLLQGDDALSLYYGSSTGDGSTALSGGDDEPDAVIDNTGTGFDDVPGEINNDSPDYLSGELYDNGNSTTYTEVLEEIRDYQQQQLDTLNNIHYIIVLVFAFLLMEWTEKKINVIVNRFTNRRR